ncbi:hypothetical protein [Haloferula sp. BvORR071]|uniref:hypothetical protein n=1 Tax=Haloferula sp. BvORR071 TaxID=1396141 RepID=UPI00054FFA6E|nr:hypothetical protein [Haloferula sp. BvORR071]
MDTLKILLAATVALLLGALAVSYKDGSTSKTAVKEELAAMEQKLERLRLEQDGLARERELQMLRDAANKAAAVAPVAPPAPLQTADMAAMQDQIAKLEAEKAAADAKTAKAERKADTYNEEAAFVGGQMLEHRDNELRRARLIKDAMPIGRVKEWVEDPQNGSFAVIEVLMAENVQEETVLCVRRNTGILGKVKVGQISIEGAIGSPTTAFSELKPQPGDDLIMDPTE